MPDPRFRRLESIRNKLQKNNDYILINDFGAGSRASVLHKRKVKDIVKSASSRPQFSRLLFALAAHFQPKQIIELGTSFGINTMYLALNKNADVITFEGCGETLQAAKPIFDQHDFTNIKVVEGDIDSTFPAYIATRAQVDFVYFDANHRYFPTLHYFHTCLGKVHENTVFIFDDIHWSGEMELAWKTIQAHPAVTLSLDIYDAGLIFFNAGLTKQHFVLKY